VDYEPFRQVEIGKMAQGGIQADSSEPMKSIEFIIPTIITGNRIEVFCSIGKDRGAKRIEFRIYDIYGSLRREWQSILDKPTKFELDVGGLGSGVYFLQIRSGGYLMRKKIILLKK